MGLSARFGHLQTAPAPRNPAAAPRAVSMTISPSISACVMLTRDPYQFVRRPNRTRFIDDGRRKFVAKKLR